MTIDLAPDQTLPAPSPPPSWGELAPPGQIALVLRLVLTERTVSFPTGELRRWDHAPGTPELLTIQVGREEITIEGTDLGALRAALDLGRLCELRLTHPRRPVRPGPQIRRIAIAPA